MREFIARVKAQLRRVRFDREDTDAKSLLPFEALEFDNLIIDVQRHEARISDNPLNLKPKEFDLLLFLGLDTTDRY